MPNPVNHRQNQQWSNCDRCGRLFPLSSLVMQKGILICVQKCFDNLEIERRPFVIEDILGSGVDQEGADLRQIDRGFFEGFDDGIR